MACPICDHTMQDLGIKDISHNIYWCPRCGTLKTVNKFNSISMTFWSKRIIEAARLSKAEQNVIQSSVVKVDYHVNQRDMSEIMISMDKIN